MPTVAEEAVAQMFTESIPEAALASAVLRKLSHGQIREAAYAWILACISDERRVRELRAQAGARAEIRRKTRERANAAGFSTVTEMKSTHLRLGALLDKSFRTINKAKTVCQWGHEFTPENTYVDKHGWRYCRKCQATKAQRLRDGVRPLYGPL